MNEFHSTWKKQKEKKKEKITILPFCIDPIATAVCHRSSNSIILFFNEFLNDGFKTLIDKLRIQLS